MKIQKIQQLCKSAKRIIIFNVAKRREGIEEESGGLFAPERDRAAAREEHVIQWISDGYCIFPLLNLPRLTEDNIYTLFDIPEDKRGKIFFEEREELPRSLCFEDYFEGECAVKPEAFGIVAYGRALEVIRGAEGAILYDKKYFSVFDDDVILFERLRPAGSPYIVAKEGMFIAGVIMPFEPNITLKEWLTNVAETLRFNEQKEYVEHGSVIREDPREEEAAEPQ